MMSAGMLKPSTGDYRWNMQVAAGMDQRRGVKHDRDREKLPEPGMVIDTGGEGIDRNVAECVVEKMADQVGEQHQSAAETNLADADAADETCDLLLRERGHAIQSNPHRQRSTIVEFNSIGGHFIRVAGFCPKHCCGRQYVDTSTGVGEKAP